MSQANSQEMSTTHFLNIKFSATLYTFFDNPRSSLPFLLGLFAILRKQNISFMSVSPHRKKKSTSAVQIIVEFVLGFSKICLENFKIGKEE